MSEVIEFRRRPREDFYRWHLAAYTEFALNIQAATGGEYDWEKAWESGLTPAQAAAKAAHPTKESE